VKQRITIKQWMELSQRGRKIIFSWAKKKGYAESLDIDAVPLLSIGQMIEFLDEEAEINEFRYHRTTPYWEIALTNRSIVKKPRTGHKWFGPEIELVDTLWQAVKEILNES